eukprot:gnl/Dysnectes_brevis/6173_a9354_371.p1 GENE.gnl/Dysnectes_brevis/6173_a9354_371~~gnl/Dysnectes_brevis/6173_a9354_371.p1  ORF type:complete len:322 (-),score=-19.62 gnl/Dysnectes_brevis/6173_a9354_371:72-1037(-)
MSPDYNSMQSFLSSIQDRRDAIIQHVQSMPILSSSLFIALSFFSTGLPYKRLSTQIQVPHSTISTIVTRVINGLQDWSKLQIHFIPHDQQAAAMAPFQNARAIADCTVIPIERPHFKSSKSKGKKTFTLQHCDDQAAFYSGKHKFHCVKVDAIHSMNGRCMKLSDVVAGAMHDKKLHETHQKAISDYLGPHHAIMVDKGYIGIGQFYSPGRVHVPYKGSQLSADQMRFNSALSRYRIRCEQFYVIRQHALRELSVRMRVPAPLNDKLFVLIYLLLEICGYPTVFFEQTPVFDVRKCYSWITRYLTKNGISLDYILSCEQLY